MQNILGVTAYFLHGIILSTSVTVYSSEGSLNTFHLFNAFLSMDICTQCFKIITQISFLYTRNATSVCLQLSFLGLKFLARLLALLLGVQGVLG